MLLCLLALPSLLAFRFCIVPHTATIQVLVVSDISDSGSALFDISYHIVGLAWVFSEFFCDSLDGGIGCRYLHIGEQIMGDFKSRVVQTHCSMALKDRADCSHSKTGQVHLPQL
jgi:hypothetical protein